MRISYAARRPEGKPNRLVADAVGMVADAGGRALDVGAGSLADTRVMLAAGLRVDAVDPDPVATCLAAELGHPRLTMITEDIRRWRIDPSAYTLIAAIHVLPFLPAADLGRVMAALRRGLADRGLLCATLFGERDAWAGKRPLVTFLGSAEVEGLLEPFDVVSFAEDEFDGNDVLDRPKRWHVFRFVARRHRSRSEASTGCPPEARVC